MLHAAERFFTSARAAAGILARCVPVPLPPGLEARLREAGRAPRSAVRLRRFTPTEWERLQGFPDGWTVDPG